MNEKFFKLPVEKQQKIINAGFHVFARNTYKKSPVSEIADAAGISKSLLFHYFHNKKELYLFLWDTLARLTMEALEEFGCYEGEDLFEIMRLGLKAKVQIMKEYPDIGFFALKAFYEKDSEIAMELRKDCEKRLNIKAMATLLKLDPQDFVPGIDLNLMYRDMYWATEGYLLEMLQKEEFSVEKMEQDFTELIGFWEKVYRRKEGDHEYH